MADILPGMTLPPNAPGDPGGEDAPYPTEMPGLVRAARALTFTAVAVNLLVAVLTLAVGLSDAEELERDYDVEASTLVIGGVVFLVHGALGAFLGARFAAAGGGLRLAAMVWAAFGAFLGLVSVPLGLLNVVLSILVLVFLFQSPARAWFGRPRAPRP